MRRMCAVILRRPYSPSGVIFRFVVPSGSVTVVQAVSRTASTTIASVTVRGEIRPCRVIKHDGVWREADMLENAAEPLAHTPGGLSGERGGVPRVRVRERHHEHMHPGAYPWMTTSASPKSACAIPGSHRSSLNPHQAGGAPDATVSPNAELLNTTR